MERSLLVEGTLLDVAAPDIVVAESPELIVAVMFAQQFVIGDVMVTAIAEEPYVGLARFIQDSFER